MKQEIRQKAQHDFENETPPVIVCTVAFGMGIDKANVRHVVHYNLPWLAGKLLSRSRARRTRWTAGYVHLSLINRRISSPSGFSPIEIIRPTSRFSQCSSAFASAPDIVRAAEILEHVDIADSALNSALDVLKQNQLICQDSDGGYFAPQALSGSVRIDTTDMIRRKRRDQERLEAIISYAQQRCCRRMLILRYFGQQLNGNRCGACDVCSPRQLITATSNCKIRDLKFPSRRGPEPPLTPVLASVISRAHRSAPCRLGQT